MEEYLRHGHTPHALYVSELLKEEYMPLVAAVEKSRVFFLKREVFAKISTEKAPQGILTVSDYLDNIVFLNADSECSGFFNAVNGGLLFLDSLQDNGNVGTIIRTAAALGSVACVLSGDCADIYGSKTVRASMGAMFSAKIAVVSSLQDAVMAATNSGRRVFAAALNESALELDKFTPQTSDCYVIGNEGKGVSGEIISLCRNTLKIPITDAAESLNASVAAAILLWEHFKGGGRIG